MLKPLQKATKGAFGVFAGLIGQGDPSVSAIPIARPNKPMAEVQDENMVDEEAKDHPKEASQRQSQTWIAQSEEKRSDRKPVQQSEN